MIEAPSPSIGQQQQPLGQSGIKESDQLEEELLEESVVLTETEASDLAGLLESGHHEESPLDSSGSLYYDASTMASLNPLALAAINRFRNFKPPPFSIWDTLPARRRAAVLVLLFADRWGDLRVVVTMRAATLRNFSGHAALPGGKADSVDETPYQIARREAYEEIGLPMDDARIPRPFRIEQLCCLPPAMARTHVVVLPCVAFLHADRKEEGGERNSGDSSRSAGLVEESLIPRLDATEVAAVFSAPLYNFLKARDLPPRRGETLPPGHWYDGSWISWEGTRWRTHNFYVPVNNQRVSKPRRSSRDVNGVEEMKNSEEKELEEEEEEEEMKKAEEEAEEEEQSRFKVWGLTGRMLLDAARVGYGEEPEMEHCESYGDGEVIERVMARGGFDDRGGEAKRRDKDAKM